MFSRGFNIIMNGVTAVSEHKGYTVLYARGNMYSGSLRHNNKPLNIAALINKRLMRYGVVVYM